MSSIALDNRTVAPSFSGPAAGQKRKYHHILMQDEAPGGANTSIAQVLEETSLANQAVLDFTGLPIGQEADNMLQVGGVPQGQFGISMNLAPSNHLLALEGAAELAQSVLPQDSMDATGLLQTEPSDPDLGDGSLDAVLQQQNHNLEHALQQNRNLQQALMSNYALPPEAMPNSYQEVPGIGTTGGGPPQDNDFSLYNQQNLPRMNLAAEESLEIPLPSGLRDGQANLGVQSSSVHQSLDEHTSTEMADAGPFANAVSGPSRTADTGPFGVQADSDFDLILGATPAQAKATRKQYGEPGKSQNPRKTYHAGTPAAINMHNAIKGWKEETGDIYKKVKLCLLLKLDLTGLILVLI
jgi:hypothetical protein